MAPHPSLDHTQSLFKTHVFGRLVVIVGLQVECCDVIHHLQTVRDNTDVILPSYPLLCSLFCMFLIYVPYYNLGLVGKSPDTSCHLNGKYDKQEEEELHER